MKIFATKTLCPCGAIWLVLDINQFPLILGYLAIDQYIAYACNTLKTKYFLVQQELAL